MKIGVLVAMEKEFSALRSILFGHSEVPDMKHKTIRGIYEGKEIILQQCGVGKVNSAIGTVEMIKAFQPDAVISTGCAGGASLKTEPGDVVAAAECVYHDVSCGSETAYGQMMGMPARYVSDAYLLEKTITIDTEIRIHRGLTVSGDWFVTTKEKMGFIIDRFPEAMAVDMESCSIAQTCHIYGVPFLSFRIISDVPLRDIDASQYYDFWDNMAGRSFEITRRFLDTL